MLAVGLVAGACRSDTVSIEYRWVEGSSTTYRLTAEANAQWNVGTPGSGSYRVVFEVTEHVDSVTADAAEVSVEMTPLEVEENGLPSPGAEGRSFSLRVALGGQVLEVLTVDGVSAAELDPAELAFIGTYRPPLPDERKGLSDSWETPAEQTGSVFQQIETYGRLARLGRDREGKFAELDYRGTGPLVWTTSLPQGAAELTGTASTTSDVVFDLEGGYLRSGRSATVGDFEVRVVREGEHRVPIQGRLRLELDLEVTRVS
jgi:hypothetical protein